MSTVYLKQGDRLPALRVQLLDANGAALDVTSATVTFRMRDARTKALKVAAGSTTKPNGGADGVVQYAWATGDTDIVGSFEAEFACAFSGLVQTVPTNSYVTVVVVDSLV
jgi:hypothetical protein